MAQASSFAARPVSALGVESVGGWPTKMYGIAAVADAPRLDLVQAARECAAGALRSATPAVAAAFVVAHDARPGCFVLVCWWEERVDLRLRYFRAPLDRPGALAELARPAFACVWELPVIAHERDAWVRHVLAKPGGPDLDGYLRDQMQGPTDWPAIA